MFLTVLVNMSSVNLTVHVKLKRLMNRSRLQYLLIIFSVMCLGVSANTYSKENTDQHCVTQDVQALLGVPLEYVEAQRKVCADLVVLGKRLFFDQRLSRDGTVSCATCHDPEKAFADGLVVAEGVNGRRGARNTPTVLNAALMTSQFWDGRSRTLEEQAKEPFVNPDEHGLANHGEVMEMISQLPEYQPLFENAFGVDMALMTIDHVAEAIAAYERTLVAANSPFDRFYFAQEDQALSLAAKAGWQLFNGRAGCSQCHSISEKSALFSDNEFHVSGVGLASIQAQLADLTKKVYAQKNNLTQHVLSQVEARAVSELGRFNVTLNPKDIGKFKTPSLRNVALTAPYMHDGSVETLEEVIEIELYSHGEGDRSLIILTPQEKAYLVEFLKSLTSEVLPR